MGSINSRVIRKSELAVLSPANAALAALTELSFTGVAPEGTVGVATATAVVVDAKTDDINEENVKPALVAAVDEDAVAAVGVNVVPTEELAVESSLIANGSGRRVPADSADGAIMTNSLILHSGLIKG